MKGGRSVRIGFAVTDSRTVRAFLQNQIEDLRHRCVRTWVFCGGERLFNVFPTSVNCEWLPFAREISFFKDFQTLLQLILSSSFRRLDIINSSTPKAGLIGMLAAWVCQIPVRIYVVRGLRYETAIGWKRRILMLSELVSCACAHRVICVSESVRREMIANRLVSFSKSCVLGRGSSNGVQFERFAIRNDAEVRRIANQLQLPPDVPVVGFVGRLTKDKGIADLCQVFTMLKILEPRVHLLIVGDFEAGDPVSSVVQHAIMNDPQIRITGFIRDTSAYYHLMDVLCFPSYREGFPNVPLEAACARIPTVGFAATGTVDAVVNNVTGYLVPVGDITGLTEAIRRYLSEPQLRNKHGLHAQQRARTDFSPERIASSLTEVYSEMLVWKYGENAVDTTSLINKAA